MGYLLKNKEARQVYVAINRVHFHSKIHSTEIYCASTARQVLLGFWTHVSKQIKLKPLPLWSLHLGTLGYSLRSELNVNILKMILCDPEHWRQTYATSVI